MEEKTSTAIVPMSLLKATIVHANKYTTTHDGGLNMPVWSNLHTEIVFRVEGTGEDIRCYIKNLDLPLYSTQSVYILMALDRVIACVDAKTNYYYYLHSDYGKLFRTIMPFYIVWLTGIIGGAVIYWIMDHLTLFMFLPFVACWIFYTIQKRLHHIRIRKQIDSFLS